MLDKEVKGLQKQFPCFVQRETGVLEVNLAQSSVTRHFFLNQCQCV